MLVFVGGNQQNLLLIKYDLWTLRTYHSTNHQQPRSPYPSNGPRLGSWITSWHSKPPGNQHIPPLVGKFGTSLTQTYWLGVGDHICEFPRRVKNKKNKKHFLEKPPEKHLSRNIFWSKPFPRASGITYCATHTAQRAWISALGSDGKKSRKVEVNAWHLEDPWQMSPRIVGPSEIIS